MHNPGFFMENDTHKILWDFDIQTDHSISVKRPVFIIIKYKKRELVILLFLLCGLTKSKIERKEKKK